VVCFGGHGHTFNPHCEQAQSPDIAQMPARIQIGSQRPIVNRVRMKWTPWLVPVLMDMVRLAQVGHGREDVSWGIWWLL